MSKLVTMILGAGGVLALSCTALAQGGAAAGVYSKAQAERGAALYADNCARCHGASMEGMDVAPSLTGPRFLTNWQGQPVGSLSARIRTSMPLDMPGIIGLQASADITADILAQNGYPSGAAELPSSNAQQQVLTLDAPPAK